MQDSYQQDEITLKELILKIQEYAVELRRNWFVIAGVVALAMAIQLYRYTQEVTTYNAEVRFVVEGQQGSGGGLSSLLGSFGIKKGGRVNPYKLLEVGRSSSILRKVLSERNEQGVMLANALIEEYKLDEKWGKSNPKLDGFRYLSELYSRPLDTIESKVLRKLQTVVWGNKNSRDRALLKFDLNEDTGIYTINCTSKNEDISLDLAESYYSYIKDFFEEDVFQNQKQLADILDFKADSLNLARDEKILELARFRESNRGRISSQQIAKEKILNQEQLAINAALVEIIKNKEMTDVNLKDMQPLFMAIDYPFVPLPSTSPSLIKSLSVGILLATFFAICLILLNKIYKEIMATE